MDFKKLEEDLKNLEAKTVEELKQLASDLNIEGRSNLTKKEDLKAAVQEHGQRAVEENKDPNESVLLSNPQAEVEAEVRDAKPADDSEFGQSPEDIEKQAEGDANQPVPEQEAALGHHQPESDPHNPEVQENLSSSGQEALDKMGEDSVAAEEADLRLDASGPLHLQDPAQRVMTGAVNEDHAEEQAKLVEENKPEGYTGEVNELGQPLNPVAADATTQSEEDKENPTQG
jgi:hypothetical protein